MARSGNRDYDKPFTRKADKPEPASTVSSAEVQSLLRFAGIDEETIKAEMLKYVSRQQSAALTGLIARETTGRWELSAQALDDERQIPAATAYTFDNSAARERSASEYVLKPGDIAVERDTGRRLFVERIETLNQNGKLTRRIVWRAIQPGVRLEARPGPFNALQALKSAADNASFGARELAKSFKTAAERAANLKESLEKIQREKAALNNKADDVRAELPFQSRLGADFWTDPRSGGYLSGKGQWLPADINNAEFGVEVTADGLKPIAQLPISTRADSAARFIEDFNDSGNRNWDWLQLNAERQRKAEEAAAAKRCTCGASVELGHCDPQTTERFITLDESEV